MEALRVPQRKISARVNLADGRYVEGRLFTPEAGPDGAPGRIVDRLNAQACRYLPVSSEDGAASLVNLSWIVSVELDLTYLATEMGGDPPTCDKQVRVRLADGSEVIGRMAYSMPPERDRLIDHLNDGATFIPLLGDALIMLLNNDYIVEVAELIQPA